MLTTEGLVADIKEKEKKAAGGGMPPGGGGPAESSGTHNTRMGGMY